VYIRYSWQGNYQIYSHIQCIYPVPANPACHVIPEAGAFFSGWGQGRGPPCLRALSRWGQCVGQMLGCFAVSSPPWRFFCMKKAHRSNATTGPCNSAESQGQHIVCVHEFVCDSVEVHMFGCNSVEVHMFGCNSVEVPMFGCNSVEVHSLVVTVSRSTCLVVTVSRCTYVWL
jgi:hypothetical protein